MDEHKPSKELPFLDDIRQIENGANSVSKLKQKSNSFLYDFQLEAVKNAFNGCVFNGDVGSGKSRTGLFYFFKEQGG